MKLKSLIKLIVASGLLISPLSWSAPVAVKNGVIFALNTERTHLVVAPLSPTGSLPSTCQKEFVVSSEATDVVVSRNVAVVTPGTDNKDFDSIDVSACLPVLNGSQNTTVDLQKGELEILCAKVGNTFYHVIMKERGNSTNWEVTFADPDPSCTPSGD